MFLSFCQGWLRPLGGWRTSARLLRAVPTPLVSMSSSSPSDSDTYTQRHHSPETPSMHCGGRAATQTHPWPRPTPPPCISAQAAYTPHHIMLWWQCHMHKTTLRSSPTCTGCSIGCSQRHNNINGQTASQTCQSARCQHAKNAERAPQPGHEGCTAWPAKKPTRMPPVQSLVPNACMMWCTAACVVNRGRGPHCSSSAAVLCRTLAGPAQHSSRI